MEKKDRPVFGPGDVLCSDDGEFAFRVVEHIGEGRCCLVYSARAVRDGAKVALKVFKRGPNYEGAIQREQYILEAYQDPRYNIVTCFGCFIFEGLFCQVMELLEYNIRQLIFRNDRQGLSPWITQKFAKDLLTALAALHDNCFVHADLKPANVMWSSYDGRFKLLDFGLTFHTQEPDLHQVQSPGYKAPETAEWNKFKDDERRNRKRRLQGTYSDLSAAAPAFSEGLDALDATTAAAVRSDEDQHRRQGDDQRPACPVASGETRDVEGSPCRKPPPSRVPPDGGNDDDVIYYERRPRPAVGTLPEEHGGPPATSSSGKAAPSCSQSVSTTTTTTTKWPSESSGIFTGSSACRTPSPDDRGPSSGHTSHCPSQESNTTWRSSGMLSEDALTIGDNGTRLTVGSSCGGTANSSSISTGSGLGTMDEAPSCSSAASTSVSSASALQSSSCSASQEWRKGRSSGLAVVRKRPTTSAALNAEGRHDPAWTSRRISDCRRPARPVSTCAELAQVPRKPHLPDEKSDIWSFGCLLVEALTGRKMFSVSDKMAAILKPLQLLEMRIGRTEVKYDELNQQRFFADAKSLIQSCLTEDPTERISAKSALEHKFFKDHELVPSVKDMVMLPSNVLRLINILEDDDDDDSACRNEKELSEVLEELKEEASKYGRITDVRSSGAHAYIEFQEASDCQKACSGLSGRTFDDRTVVAVFYPIDLWATNTLI